MKIIITEEQAKLILKENSLQNAMDWAHNENEKSRQFFRNILTKFKTGQMTEDDCIDELLEYEIKIQENAVSDWINHN